MYNFKRFTVLCIIGTFIVLKLSYAEEVQQGLDRAQDGMYTENKGIDAAPSQAPAINKESDNSRGREEVSDLQNSSQQIGSDRVDGTDKTGREKEILNFEYKSYISVGLNISSHSGIGLSYRYHTETPFLFQVSGGVISSGRSYYYAIGGEIQRELSKSKDKRAFGVFATGLYGMRYEETDYEVSYSTGMNPTKKWRSDVNFSVALGVGGELALGSSIVDAISLGVAIYPIGSYITNSGETNFKMFPGGAIYLFYNF